MRKRIIIIVLAIIVILSFIFTFTVLQKRTIKVGFVASLSGKRSQLGINARNAVIVAVNDANAAGGILGHEIELVIKDDKSDPAIIQNVIEGMIADDISFVIGPMTSNMAEPTLKAIEGKDVLVVSPTVSTDMIKGKDDNFLRVIPVASTQGENLAKIIDRNKLRKVAVVHDISNKAYTSMVVKQFINTITDKSKIVYENDLKEKEKPDYMAIASDIKRAKADCVLFVTSSIDAAAICQQLKKINYPVPRFGSFWVKTGNIIELGGKSVEGMVVTTYFERGEDNKSDALRQFRTTYENMFRKDVNFVTVYAYDAFQVLATGIKRAKSLKPEMVKKAIIQQQKFNGLEEIFEIDQYGDAKRARYYSKIQNGTFIYFE